LSALFSEILHSRLVAEKQVVRYR